MIVRETLEQTSDDAPLIHLQSFLYLSLHGTQFKLCVISSRIEWTVSICPVSCPESLLASMDSCVFDYFPEGEKDSCIPAQRRMSGGVTLRDAKTGIKDRYEPGM